jgi:hypothetical protein
MQCIRKCLLRKHFILLVVLVLLWRDNTVQSFLFVLHHPETLSTRLLNSLKKQEVCVINVLRGINPASILTEEAVDAARVAIRRSPWKSVQQSAKQTEVSKPGLHGISVVMLCHFRTKCSWVSHCWKMKQQDIKLPQESIQCYWRTIWASWMLHGSPMRHISTWMVTITRKVSCFGPRESPRLTTANSLQPQRVTVCCILLRTGIFGLVFNDVTVTSDIYISLLNDECPFPDGIWHSNEFSLVLLRLCQTSHQECHTLLPS